MYKVIIFVILILISVLFLNCGDGNIDKTDSPDEEATDGTISGNDTGTEANKAKGSLVDEPRIFRRAGRTYAPITAIIDVNVDDKWSGVKELEISIDVSEYEKSEAPITFEAEGLHTIKCRASDNVGNTAAPLTISLIIDDTPPETVYKLIPEPVVEGGINYVPADCTIKLNATDNLSGVQKTLYNFDGKEYEKYTGAIPMPGEGKRIFDFRSQDNVGSWEAENTLTLVVDGDEPVTTLAPNGTLFDENGVMWTTDDAQYYVSSGDEKPGEGEIFAVVGTSYSIAAKDDRAGIGRLEVSIDGAGYREYKNPISFRSEGKHRISIRAVDLVGNVSEPLMFEVTVDDSMPNTEFNLEPEPVVRDGIWFVKPTCKLTLDAEDKYSGVKEIAYSINGGKPRIYEKPIIMPGPGVHLFAFEARDIVGNWEDTDSFSVVVDGKAPITKLKPGGKVRDYKGNKYAPTSNLYYLFSTDDYAGIADIKYAVDDGQFKSYRGTIKLRPGERTITYYAVDRAGNKEKKNVFRVIVEESSYDITFSATE